MLSGAGHEEVGVARVLQHLSRAAGLSECLCAFHGGIGDNLFVLACHQVAERGRLYLAEAWAESTPFRRGGTAPFLAVDGWQNPIAPLSYGLGKSLAWGGGRIVFE